MRIILPPLWTPKCEYLWNGKGNARCKSGLEIDEYDGTRNEKDERAGRETEAQRTDLRKRGGGGEAQHSDGTAGPMDKAR